jgi:hypothetical protein
MGQQIDIIRSRALAAAAQYPHRDLAARHVDELLEEFAARLRPFTRDGIDMAGRLAESHPELPPLSWGPSGKAIHGHAHFDPATAEAWAKVLGLEEDSDDNDKSSVRLWRGEVDGWRVVVGTLVLSEPVVADA